MTRKVSLLFFLISCCWVATAKERPHLPATTGVPGPSYAQTDVSAAWVAQSSNFLAPSRGIRAFSAVDENIVWAAAYDGSGGEANITEFTRTTDGGTTWTAGDVGVAGSAIGSIFGLNADTAWAVIFPPAAGAERGIYRTNDGGTTWNKQASAAYPGAGGFPNVVYFFDENNGVTMGDINDGYFEFYTTSNGGANWTRVPEANIPPALNAGEFGIIDVYDVVGDTIWYTTNLGRVYKSSDRGLNWEVYTISDATSIGSVAFAQNGQVGLVVDNGGGVAASDDKVYRSTDGGVTWEQITTGAVAGLSSIQDVCDVPGTEGVFLGFTAEQGAPGSVYTLDAGESWTQIDNVQHLKGAFVNNTTGWSGGFSGPGVGMFAFVGELEDSISAQIQIIHNAPQPGFSTVDVYLNGEILLDDFDFRTATAVTNVPADVALTVGIAEGTSTGPDDILFTFENVTFAANTTSVVVASQDPDDEEDVTLLVNEAVFGSENAGTTAILAHHGAPDAPGVSIVEVGVSDPELELVPLFNYTDFTTAPTIPAVDGYLLEVRTSDGNAVATFGADLATLGTGGLGLTVLASGYLSPEDEEPAFGLYVATPAGGELIALPINPVRLQVIHNAPLPAAATVDVYAGDQLIADDLDFRTGTSFLTIQGGIPTVIGIALSTSTQPSDAIFTTDPITFDPGTYIAVANSGLTTESITLDVFDQAQEEAVTANSVDLLVHHGSFDAPPIQVILETASDSAALTQVLSYRDFEGYINTTAAILPLRIVDDGGNTVGTFALPTNNLTGQAVTVLASGFLNPPNPEDPALALFVVSSAGVFFPLIVTDLAAPEVASQITVYPNPAVSRLQVEASGVDVDEIVMHDLTGRTVPVRVRALDGGRYTIGTEKLARGMYLLRIDTRQGTVVERVNLTR